MPLQPPPVPVASPSPAADPCPPLSLQAEGGAEPAQLPPPNGAGPGPGEAPALRENGVGPALAALSTADQREMQSLDTHIQETSEYRRAPPGAGGREPGSPGRGGVAATAAPDRW